MWKTRRWRKLLNILDQLPRTSAYVQALAIDEELAEQRLADLPDRKPVWTRDHREYTAEVEMLSAVFDRLGELVRVTAAMRGAKGGQPQPAPRPMFAIDRVLRRRRRESHDSLVSRMLKRKPAG